MREEGTDTMTTTAHRTDVHRPATLVTEDYEFVFAEVNHFEDAPGWVQRRGDWGMEMSRWIARTDRLGRSTHQCHHCGTRINYFAVLRHLPTGDAVVVGETCLDNRFALATAEFHRLRKLAQLDRERQRIKSAVRDFVEANAELAWMADETGETVPEASQGNDFIADVARKLRTYGELSERQIEAVRRAVERDAERARERAADTDIAPATAPTGRIEVRGRVLGKKLVESQYGTTVKLLVQVPTAVDNGTVTEAWKLWVTRPRSLDVERGDDIAIKVTVEPSGDDPAFAFGKRPTAL